MTAVHVTVIFNESVVAPARIVKHVSHYKRRCGTCSVDCRHQTQCPVSDDLFNAPNVNPYDREKDKQISVEFCYIMFMVVRQSEKGGG